MLFDGRHRIEALKMLNQEEFDKIFSTGVKISIYNKFNEFDILSISKGLNFFFIF